MTLSAVLLGLAFLSAEENTLRVIVKDSSGAPVPKAHVTLSQHRDAKPSAKPAKDQEDPPTVDSMSETDARGVALLQNVLKARRYKIEVRAQGFLPWNLF